MQQKILILLGVLSFGIFSLNISFAEEVSSSQETTAELDSQAVQTDTPSEKGTADDEQDLKKNSEEAPQSESRPPSINETSDIPGKRLSYVHSPSVEVEPSTGSASMSIPIEVPPGRGGIQPSLSLNYNSSMKNGLLGVGWSLELGAIQRSLKNGPPRYNDQVDEFVLLQAGSTQELVYDYSAGFYRTKIQGGAFTKIEHIKEGSEDYWKLWDKKGNTYYFGQALDSQQQVNGKLFQWSLCAVYDVHGNYMEIRYTKFADEDYSQIYPYQIQYTHHISGDVGPFAEVNFEYGPRTDTTISYRTGFLVKNNQRLLKIIVKANNTLQRRYEFAYDPSSISNRSLLQSILQFGADGTSSLPPITFSYQSITTEWTDQATGWTTPQGMEFARKDSGLDRDKELGVRFLDYNGDGFTDALRNGWLCGTDHVFTWSYNKKGWGSATDYELPEPCGVRFIYGFARDGVEIRDGGGRLVDINGDGFVDILWYDKEPGEVVEVEQHAYLHRFDPQKNLYTWKEDAPQWKLPDGDFYNFVEKVQSGSMDRGVRFADINGDGYIDIVRYSLTEGGLGVDWGVLLNNKNGWDDKSSEWSRPPGMDTPFVIRHFAYGGSGENGGSYLIDINGDGLADFVKAKKKDDGPIIRAVYLNNGSGWVADSWTIPEALDFSRDSVEFVDINTDGLVDIVLAAGGTSRQVYLNTGHGWNESGQWKTSTEIDLRETRTRFLDADGDGLMDLMRNYEGEGGGKVFILGGDGNDNYPDLLEQVDNGVGGITRLSYTPSTRYDNTGKDDISDLPFPVQTVSAVTVTDTRLGQEYTTTYEYNDGFFNFSQDNKEFRGFGYVKTKTPAGSYTETVFEQENEYKVGRILEQTAYDAQGKIQSKTINDWETREIAAGIQFVFLKDTDNYVYDDPYDAEEAIRRTHASYEYDGTGNLTTATQYGEVLPSDPALRNEPLVDIGDDLRVVETQYLNNFDRWLIGLPTQTIVRDHTGTVVRQSWFYYDDDPWEQMRGLLIKKEDGLEFAQGDPDNPLTTYTYDKFGNLLTTTDPIGNTTPDPFDHITKITYDPDYQMFPLITENAIGHKVFAEYYGVKNAEGQNVPLGIWDAQGKCMSADQFCGMFGQAKSTTDPNNQIVRKTYDPLGRLVKTYSPLDTNVNYPASEIEYIFFSNYFRVKTKQRIDHNQEPTIDSVNFYDGLGRLIQAKSLSETGQSIVQGQTEYNAQGQVWKKYFPFYAPESLDELTPFNSSILFTEMIYDSLGRVTETRHPVDPKNPDKKTYASVSYDGWKTTTIDENGHKQEAESDLNGRLVKRIEYTGADGRSGDYPLESYAEYAVTNYSYDSEGNLTKVIDAHLNETRIVYDNLGRKVEMNDPDMGQWTYKYDLNGNLTAQTDAKEQRIEFTYDELNRLKNKKDSFGGPLNVNYLYDDRDIPYSEGRLSQVIYGQPDNTKFAYDQLGRETQSTKTIDVSRYTVNRGYDALSRLNSLQYPDGAEIFYTYNKGGQIETISEHQEYGESQERLLIRGDGHTGSRILDDHGHRVLVVNDVKVDVLNKVWGTASVLFGGSQDYLKLDDSADWDIAASADEDWTVDFWVKHTNVPAAHQAYLGQYAARESWEITYNVCQEEGPCGLSFSLLKDYDHTFTIYSGAEIEDTNWHHVALVRTGDAGGNLYYGLYLDGRQVGYAAADFTMTIDNGPLVIGNGGEAGTNYLDGNLDEVRITKGNLFRADPRIGNGQIKVPEPGELLTKLLIHANVENGSPDVVDELGHTVRVEGDVYLDTTQKQFGESSLLFGGSEDYLKLDDSLDWNIAESLEEDFTVDFWVKHRKDNPELAKQNYIGQYTGVPGGAVWQIQYGGDTTGGVMFQLIKDAQENLTIYSYVPLDDQWHHLAVVRTGSQYGIYLDGQQIGYGSAGFTVDVAGDLWIGLEKGGTNNIDGHMDEIHMVKDNIFNAHPNDGKTDTIVVPTIEHELQYQEEEPPSYPREEVPLFNIYVKNVDYNQYGQPTKIEYGNGVTTTYQYDSLTLRLSRLLTVNSSQLTVQDLNYTYDPVGNITHIEDASDRDFDQTFTYDELNRLKTALGRYCDDGGRECLKEYRYDEIGNILEKDGLIYTYGENGAGPHAVTALSDGTLFEYDENGNMKKMTDSESVVTEYIYDAENRLVEVAKQDKVVAKYGYDGDGGRTKKIVFKEQAPLGGGQGVGLGFTFKKKIQVPIEKPNADITYYVGNLHEVKGTEKTSRIFLGSTQVASITNGNVTYYHGNHLGSTSITTDADGNLDELFESEPFGQIVLHEKDGSSEEVAWWYFTGSHRYDPESGLIFMGARYYDPSIARFLTPDTIVQDPKGNPQTFNRYSYAGNNPINNIDPTGHSWFKNFWKSVVSAVAGITAFVVSGFNPVVGFQVFSLVNSGLNLGQALVTGKGIGQAFGTFAASLALSAAFGGMGWHDIVNPAMRVGAFAVEGATIGVAGAAISGGDLGQGAYMGAATGAVMGFMTSEQFQNWRVGEGFRSNEQVASANYAKLSAGQGDQVAEMRIVSTGGHASVEIYDTQKNTFELYGKRPIIGETKESMGNMKYLMGKTTKGTTVVENLAAGRSGLPGLRPISLNQAQLDAFYSYQQTTNNTTFALSANCADWAAGAARSVGQYIPRSDYSTLGFADPKNFRP